MIFQVNSRIMKKIFLLLATAAIFAACSNDDDATLVQEESTAKLVDAKIGFSMSQTATSRAFLGAIDQQKNPDGTWNIAQDFELGDKMYITDYAGVHEFSVTEAGQTGQIKGKWGELQDGKNGIVAMAPKAAYVQKMTVSGNNPTMYFKLPDTQETRSREGSGVSYDPNAALMFACADDKEDNLWFMSVCSYVYFYSKTATATISSNTQNIGGNITLTYRGEKGTGKNVTVGDVHYGSIDGLAKVMDITASAKTISCKGVSIPGHSNVFNSDYQGAYEYMIAVKPGTYNVGDFSIAPTGNEGKKNKEQITMVPGGVYFIGCADKDGDGSIPPTTEP